jgi:nucleoside-diphosphate-sugar epimerase
MDLVTGGAGFIGSHLVEELVRRGGPVRVLDNFSTASIENLASVLDRIELVEGDILDEDTVRAAMRGVRRVFHQAALRSVPRSVDDPVSSNRVNVDGTLNVLMAARAAGVQRVVYASSSSVYGTANCVPLSEDVVPRPVSPYAVSKLAGEYYCQVFTRIYSLPTVGLRYFNVFGPRQDPESMYAAVIPRFIEAALRGEHLEVHGDGLQSRDFTDVRNVVAANCLAAQRDEAVGEVFNVACGQQHSLMDIIQMIGRELPVGARPIHWHHTQGRAGDVRHTRADLTKAERRLGYRVVVGFEAGLRDTLEAAQRDAVRSSRAHQQRWRPSTTAIRSPDQHNRG